MPPFLDNNPDVKEAIIIYCNNNLINLTASEVQEFIISKCLPQLVQTRKEETNDNSITIDTILKENGLKSITVRAVSGWMNILGFRYCERKKSYYCDSHEKPETVAYRYKFIDRYLEHELRCYCWIQLSETKYQEMINNGLIFGGTPYEYLDENGVKYYEFHVDDNLEFSDWTD